MTSEPRCGPRAVLLALVFGCLLAGLVGTHHLSVPGGLVEDSRLTHVIAAAPAGHDLVAELPPAPAPPDDHGATVLHLCLAVLTAFALLVPVLLVRLRASPGQVRAVTWMRGTTNTWASPPPVSRHLAQLCVLRT